MHRNGYAIRRALGVPLSALMLFVGAAGPLLDRAEVGPRAVIEGAHDLESCAPSHDHTLCILVGTSHPLPSTSATCVSSYRVAFRLVPAALSSAARPTLSEGHPTRGPPSA